MGPGMSYYLFRFKFEGFEYVWNDDKEGYYNQYTQKVFKRPPVGAKLAEVDWISSWREDDEEDEDEFY